MSVQLSIPVGLTHRRRHRVFTVLTMPSELLDWYIRCRLARALTAEAVQAAITEVQRTTARRLRQALDAGLLEEAAYQQDILEHQLEALRSWVNPPRRPRGRPKGSGYFATRQEFMTVVLRAMRHVQQYDPPVTKAKVARVFQETSSVKTSYRQLKTWLDGFDLSWQDLLSRIRPFRL